MTKANDEVFLAKGREALVSQLEAQLQPADDESSVAQFLEAEPNEEKPVLPAQGKLNEIGIGGSRISKGCFRLKAPVGHKEKRTMTTFKLTYYTRRWGHKDTLRIEKTDMGWHVEHLAINGDTTPDGNPFVFANLQQDSVKYPAELGTFLDVLWHQLHDGEVDDARAQQMFDDLGDWVSQCEQTQPTWKGWNA